MAESLGIFRQRGVNAMRTKFAFIGVTRSCYYAWRRAAPGRAERVARRDSHGAPRIHAELRDRGFHVSKCRVTRLMQEKGIRPPRGRRRVPLTTDSRHIHAIAPNLLKPKFVVTLPDYSLVGRCLSACRASSARTR